MLSPDNESKRLDALDQYQILDTPAEEVFDELTQLAANLCETPIALISLVDAQREWFKSKVGINVSEVSRNIAFGSYTILEAEIFIIPDILQDQRFATHPLVSSEPYLRFYAGVPLVTSSGFALGSLCVLDFVPRCFGVKEQAILQNLARQVIRYLEIHRQKIIEDSPKCFNLLCLNNPNPIWIYDAKNLQFLNVNKSAVMHYGYSREEFLRMRITDICHPEDVPLLWEALSTQPNRYSFSGQWRHCLKNQEIINVEIVGFSIYYAGRHAYLVDSRNITEHKRIELNLKAQAEREQLIRTIAQRIRQSLNLQYILDATVVEVRNWLQVDRVVVLEFAPDMSGKIVAESVETGWKSFLGKEIADTCFQTARGQDYHQGHKWAVSNIYEAGLSDCHFNLLAEFEVKANLVVPILLEAGKENSGSRLWGLLIAHQCSATRQWESHQLDLLDQLTVQIAIAIQQSSIFQQAQIELAQRQTAEVNLRSALAEKEVLLKEIHHRVKNNLQIVACLLQLQSETMNNSELTRVIRESQNRIESIALIHQTLYSSPNIGQIDIGIYIDNLATSLLSFYQIIPDRISLETHIDSVNLNVDQAIACGLIVNELMSNALKYAFPNHKLGTIMIGLHNLDQLIEMTIQDNGIGLPNDFNWRNSSSLGLSLVYDLVTVQLDGNMTVETNRGTLFKITFPQSI